MSTDTARERITATLESLPSPPWVAVEVLRITKDPEASVVELARVITQDPVLAARLLKVANSPTFGSGREITTIERATMLLGLKAVKLLALSFSLAPQPGDEPEALDLGQYWYHSLLNAVTARYWAELVRPDIAEEAFLAGLMSHLGRLILAKQTGARYRDVDRGATSWPTLGDEERLFGFTSAHVTDQVLHEWGLPSLIADCAGAMYLGGLPADDPDSARRGLALALDLAAITERVLSGGDGDAYLELERRVANHGVSSDDLGDVLVHFETHVRELADTFDVHLPPEMSHERMLELARATLIDVSMMTAVSYEQVSRSAEVLQAERDELTDRAYRDKLTGVANRAAFDDHLEREVAGAMRDGSPLGVIVLDIDHFKRFNDTYGHQAGDIVLREVAQAMSAVTRSNELLARYGGEEFALVIRNCALEAAERAGERLRATVESLEVPTPHGPLSVTISVGAAIARCTESDDGERLISFADAALYQAKQSGRNRVHVSTRS